MRNYNSKFFNQIKKCSSVFLLCLPLSMTSCFRSKERPSKVVLKESNSPMEVLGKHLFFEKHLSKDNTTSCNSCHDITKGRSGVDGLSTSVGIKNQKGGRNAPTVWNAKHLSVQFWDGRAKDLVEQAKGPITNPIEMGMPSHDDAIKKIKAIKGYQDLFAKAFPNQKDPINIDNLALAIAKFEETLENYDSPYDKFIAGDKNALSEKAKKGYELFQKTGCVTCHLGENFAGPKLPIGMGFFQKFPTFPVKEYEEKYELSKDLGRYEVTKKESDKNVFRVPTLRNIAVTGPYFHNGKVESLNEAVKIMAKTQLNKDLGDKEVKLIVSFLESLTGEFPQIKEPEPLK